MQRRILLPGEGPQGVEIALATRKRWPIPNERPLPRPTLMVKAELETHLNRHDDRRLRSCDSTYNCMGLVFGSRRTCIEPEHFHRIVADDEFRKFDRRTERPYPGDLVAWTLGDDVEHVGLVAQVRVETKDSSGLIVLSKWGRSGEFLHDIDDLPAAMLIGGPLKWELWTDRKDVER